MTVQLLKFNADEKFDENYNVLKEIAEAAGLDWQNVQEKFKKIHDNFNPVYKQHLQVRSNKLKESDEIIKQAFQSSDDKADDNVVNELIPALENAGILTYPTSQDLTDHPVEQRVVDRRLPGPGAQLPCPADSDKFSSKAEQSLFSPIDKLLKKLGKNKWEYLTDVLKLPEDISNQALTFRLIVSDDKSATLQLKTNTGTTYDVPNFYYAKGQHKQIYIAHNDYNNKYLRLDIDQHRELEQLAVTNAMTTMPDCEDGASLVKQAAAWHSILCTFTGTLDYATVNTHRTSPERTKTLIDNTGKELIIPNVPLPIPRAVGLHRTLTNADGNEVREFIINIFVFACAYQAAKSQDKSVSEVDMLPVFLPKRMSVAELATDFALFTAVEQATGLVTGTLRGLIMDEEFSMTLNLLPAMHDANQKKRLIGTNTGFLDWMASFMDFFMHAAPFNTIAELASSENKKVYEELNTLIAYYHDLYENGSAGKGMLTEYKNLERAFSKQPTVYAKSGANATWFAEPESATATSSALFKLSKEKLSSKVQKIGKLSPQQLLDKVKVLHQILLDPRKAAMPENQRKNQDLIGQELKANMYKLTASAYEVIEKLKGASAVTYEGMTEMSDFAVIRLLVNHTNNWQLHKIVDSDLIAQYINDAIVQLNGEKGICISEQVINVVNNFTNLDWFLKNRADNSTYVEAELLRGIKTLQAHVDKDPATVHPASYGDQAVTTSGFFAPAAIHPAAINTSSSFSANDAQDADQTCGIPCSII